MVQVTVAGIGELEGAEADVVEGLVVDAKGGIRVLDQLVHGEGGIVWLDDRVGDLGGGNDGEGAHHAVGELLPDLADQQGAHARAGATTQGVAHLESLQAVAALGLLSDHIQDRVNQFGALGVVSLGPIVASTGLTENKVVGTEELAKGTGTDGIHGARFEVNQDGSGDVFAGGGLVVVDIDALELQVGSSPSYAPVGLIPCSPEMTSQNLAPIWLPH